MSELMVPSITLIHIRNPLKNKGLAIYFLFLKGRIILSMVFFGDFQISMSLMLHDRRFLIKRKWKVLCGSFSHGIRL